MKAFFKVICYNNDKKYIIKKEVVDIIHKYGYGENIYYTILFDDGVKLDYIKEDFLEFIEEVNYE